MVNSLMYLRFTSFGGKTLRAVSALPRLAVTEGRYYRPWESYSVMMVRQFAPTDAAWEAAVEAFRTARRRTIMPPRPKAPGPR